MSPYVEGYIRTMQEQEIDNKQRGEKATKEAINE